MSLPLGIFDLSPGTMLVIGAVAVLLFGERLPEVGRSLGRQILQLKKGLEGVQNHIKSAADIDVDLTRAVPGLSKITSLTGSSSYSSSSSSSYAPSNHGGAPTYHDDVDDHDEATAPKFEPPA
jgi:sec-independent protein translocase protein TatA